jgi:adenylate cyclase
MQKIPDFFKELWKRKVVQFGAIYVGASWLVLQAAIAIESTAKLPDWLDQTVLVFLVLGFPLTLLLAWAQDSSVSKAGSSPSPQTNKDEKPGIAVLPFINMSDDQENEYFADGMTEDIITGLSLSQHLSVKSRTSTFSYKGTSPDIREVGRALGVQYVAEGSVRPMGERIRITVQLIEAETGNHIWAEKYDRPIDTLFDVQDEVIDAITSALGANLTKAEATRARNLKPGSLSAWQVVQKALLMEFNIKDRKYSSLLGDTIKAVREAADKEPDYAYAHSLLAWLLNIKVTNGVSDNWRADLEEAKEHLQYGLSLAPEDPFNLNLCAAALGYAGKNERAEELCQKALQINPNFPDVYFTLAQVYTYEGRFEEAEEALDTLEAMAPNGLSSLYAPWYRAISKSMQGEHEKAEKLLLQVNEIALGYHLPYIVMAITLEALGRPDEAREAIKKALELQPDITVKRISANIRAHPDKEEGQRRIKVLKELWPS